MLIGSQTKSFCNCNYIGMKIHLIYLHNRIPSHQNENDISLDQITPLPPPSRTYTHKETHSRKTRTILIKNKNIPFWLVIVFPPSSFSSFLHFVTPIHLLYCTSNASAHPGSILWWHYCIYTKASYFLTSLKVLN